MNRLLQNVSFAALFATGVMGFTGLATANDKLDQLSQSDENWVMPGKDYHSDNFSKLTQINADNVKDLKAAWSFSTGVLNGHEGAPLVIDGTMYVHTSFPNITFALDLDNPTRIFSGRTSRSKIRPPARSPAAISSTGDWPIGQATRRPRR